MIGNKTKITIVKNKLAKPFTSIETDLIFGEGIRYDEPQLFDWAIERGIIEKKGSWYFLPHDLESVSFEHSIDSEALGKGSWSFLKDKLLGDTDHELEEKTAEGDESKIQLGQGKAQAIESLHEIDGFFPNLETLCRESLFPSRGDNS